MQSRNCQMEGWQRGALLFPGREDSICVIRLAEEKFKLAIESRPDYVSAYLGLGNVYLERAQLRLQLEQPAGDVALAKSSSH